MVGATRSAYRKPPVRAKPSSSQASHHYSSGTTVLDDEMSDHRDVLPRKTELLSARTNTPHFGQDCEPVSAEADASRRGSGVTVGGEADPLGEHMKEAVSTISKLEGLGLQRLQIPLPKCVVLGEQSTGKSSVIEAISGIRTPRSTETCTRCPLFIKMEPSDKNHPEWQAKIFLRTAYAYDGKSRNRFPGWVARQEPTDTFFISTNRPQDLEELIARAQLATLAPMADPKDFLHPAALSRDDNTYTRLDFSPNVVCIHVSQSELPSLSFYDLPGIIGQSESVSKFDQVKFVRDLVSDYISDRDALILVTCSLENDIANSTAGGIARNLKAVDRCVGVLTKPDRLPPGSRDDKLQAVLDGKRFALGHGYFVVKNPGQDALDQGLSHRDARLEEQEFFGRTEPWSTTFEAYHSQFGTINLQSFLSRRLTSQMLKMLPVIHHEVEARLREVEEALKHLPEPPSYNATRIILNIILEFSGHIRKEMEAEYPHRTWRNTWETLHKNLIKGLMSMKPTMATSGQKDEGIFTTGGTLGKSADASIVIDSDDEDEDTAMAESPETPSKKRKMDNNTPEPSRAVTPAKGKPQRPETPLQPEKRKSEVPDKEYLDKRKVFRLDEVTQHLKETSKAKVPDQIEPKVIDDLIIAAIEHWHLPLERFFDSLESELKSQVQSIFHDHFGMWHGSALYHDAWLLVEEMLNTHFTEQRTTMAAESLNNEREGPYIYNEDVFNRERVMIHESYRSARFRARMKIYGKESEAHTGKPFTRQDEEKLRKDEKKRALIAAEPYEVEIPVVAQVTSYYITAARRFYEAVCMPIESKFFKRLRTALRGDLETGLGIFTKDGPEAAIQLLAEPAHRLEQRRKLESKKKALLDGLKCLNELQEKYDEGTTPTCLDNGVPVKGFGSFGPTSTPMTEDMEDITRSKLARR